MVAGERKRKEMEKSIEIKWNNSERNPI